jgi:cell division protein FtsQ
MARSQGPQTPDEDAFSASRADRGRDEEASPSRARSRKIVLDQDDDSDDRFADLEKDEQSPFLRGQKRVPVRRGALPKKTANRVRIALVGLAILAVVGGAAAFTYRYGTSSWRFRIESSDQIEIAGNQNVTRSQVMRVMGGDIGRNIFFVPLEERQKHLEDIPWVESAAVMRFLPNRLKVEVKERTPVAFVQVGSKIELIDRNGVIMNMPPSARGTYSFPVIVGTTDAEPLSTRSARMKIFSQLVSDLDAGGANYSKDLSDVDLSDPEDVRITVPDPAGAVLVHLGSSSFLERYKIYVANAQKWRDEYHKLDSVDLRYEGQVIVNPDSRATMAASEAKPVHAAPVAAKKTTVPKQVATKKPVEKKKR